MFAVLSGLAGLGVAVMQNDQPAAQGFATMLSAPEIEPVAKEVIEMLSEISQHSSNTMPSPKIEIVS
jgi:hypothetical protein